MVLGEEGARVEQSREPRTSLTRVGPAVCAQRGRSGSVGGEEPFPQKAQQPSNIHRENMNRDLLLTPYTKINPNSTINLNAKHETITVLEENKGKNLRDVGLSENFLGQRSMTHKRKKSAHWTPPKLKTSALRETVLIG